jgi:hypothetical protein
MNETARSWEGLGFGGPPDDGRRSRTLPLKTTGELYTRPFTGSFVP